MRTYPIMLNVTDRLCVVVGAGAVGLRKAERLTDAGARVRLVDPAEGVALPEGVEHLRQAYDASVLDGAMVAFACTDDTELNARIAADARERHCLINVADVPALCDFYAAASITDGDVVVAIGTGGSAPALAGRLKDVLADALPERVGEYADALQQMRTEIIARVGEIDRRSALLKRLASAEGQEAFLTGGLDALREMVSKGN